VIRVLLVAPSPALRAGLRSLLAADTEISVVGEQMQWDGTDEAQNEVDVVLAASTSLASVEADEVNRPSSIPILFLQEYPLNPQRAMQWSSLWGVLPLESSAGELCAAVRALAQGLTVGTRELLFSGDDQVTDRGPLTDREAQVLGWLAKGLANKQIALELGISEHTVKFHISSIYAKLNAANRTQAVREGLRNGWIPL
jgi:DNA-binding NarL/FixJ family response regulator